MEDRIKKVEAFLGQDLLELIKKNEFNDKSCDMSLRKKRNLEKENRILIFELSIYKKVFEIIKINQKSDEFLISKKIVERDIEGKNMKYLQDKVKNLQDSVTSLRKQNESMKKELEERGRKEAILEKKVKKYDSKGGIYKLQKLKQEIQYFKGEKEKQEKCNGQLKKKIKELNSKVNTLNQLNQQTENKLVQLMVYHQNFNCGTKGSQNRNSININCGIKEKSEENKKVELYAAKQEIKRLKNKVSELEKQKEILKKCHEEKESLYSKMIIKNH